MADLRLDISRNGYLHDMNNKRYPERIFTNEKLGVFNRSNDFGLKFAPTTG